MRPAVFLDRDGTIIEEVGYLRSVDQLNLCPGAALAIRDLNRHQIPVVVITNQSGVARGFFDEAFVRETHRTINERLARLGGRIDAFYHCPHHPDGTVGPYVRNCECRKPGIALLEAAARDLDLDLRASFVVGDKELDLVTARRAGAAGILILTGYGKEEWRRLRSASAEGPAHVAGDLPAAVAWIVARLRGSEHPAVDTRQDRGRR